MTKAMTQDTDEFRTRARIKETTAVAKRPDNAPAPTNDGVAIWQIIERMASNPAVDPDKLDRLIALQERMLARNCQIAFDTELAAIQQKLPTIDRKGRIEIRKKDARGERTGDVQQSSPYALYEDIVEAITPILGEHGFAIRFETGLTDDKLVKVIGILSGCGHREKTEIVLQHDATGSKNSNQAVVSSTSYGKRMAACALLNIVSRGEDDDGKASGASLTTGDAMTAEQAAQLIDLCDALQCPRDRLRDHLNKMRPKGHPEAMTLAALPTSRFDEAVTALRSYETSRKEREAAAAKGGNK